MDSAVRRCQTTATPTRGRCRAVSVLGGCRGNGDAAIPTLRPFPTCELGRLRRIHGVSVLAAAGWAWRRARETARPDPRQRETLAPAGRSRLGAPLAATSAHARWADWHARLEALKRSDGESCKFGCWARSRWSWRGSRWTCRAPSGRRSSRVWRCARVGSSPTDTLVEALWGSDLPAAPRNAVQHHVTRLRRALGGTRSGSPPTGTRSKAQRGRHRVRGAARGCARRSPRRRCARSRGDDRRRAVPLARACAARSASVHVGHGGGRAAGRAAGRRVGGAVRGGARARRARRARARHTRRARGEPVPRAAVGAVDARALPKRPPGGRARGVPGGPARALEQLALEPGPELRRLQEAILAHDPAIAPVPPAPRRRGNLPAPSTSFIGREAELAQVVELLREHRLVTLTGPPGVGKSRLALEAARSLESEVRGRRVARRSRARGKRRRRRPPRRAGPRRPRRRSARAHRRAPS